MYQRFLILTTNAQIFEISYICPFSIFILSCFASMVPSQLCLTDAKCSFPGPIFLHQAFKKQRNWRRHCHET